MSNYFRPYELQPTRLLCVWDSPASTTGMGCCPPGNLHDSRIEPMYLMSPALAGGFFTTSTTSTIAYIWIVYCCVINYHEMQRFNSTKIYLSMVFNLVVTIWTAHFCSMHCHLAQHWIGRFIPKISFSRGWQNSCWLMARSLAKLIVEVHIFFQERHFTKLSGLPYSKRQGLPKVGTEFDHVFRAGSVLTLALQLYSISFRTLRPSQIPGNWKTTYKCHPPTKQQNLTFVGRSRKDFLTFLIHHSWYMEEVGIRPTIIRRFKSIIIDDDKLIPTCLQISVNKEHWFL